MFTQWIHSYYDLPLMINQDSRVLWQKGHTPHATPEEEEKECNGIIKMAKAKLAPSTLALRNGETAENNKGIRTISSMFVSSSEDKTWILDQIEKKIERATMIPRGHGE
ncbi:hypothetical protein Tco_1452348, partial [Tanacetum coccineum]